MISECCAKINLGVIDVNTQTGIEMKMEVCFRYFENQTETVFLMSLDLNSVILDRRIIFNLQILFDELIV